MQSRPPLTTPLIPFVAGSHGAFYPLDTSHVHGGHNPAATHKNIFGPNGPHPCGGKVALAIEEVMIRNIANRMRIMSDGIGAFDVELGGFQAAEQIIDHGCSTVVHVFHLSGPVTTVVTVIFPQGSC